MKIYTKTGDKGQTSLYDNSRIEKDSLRVESYGTIDELNSNLGFARNFVEDDGIVKILYDLQRDLFNVAGELATRDRKKFPERIHEGHVTNLEKIIDDYLEKIDKVGKFIIPGSNKASASLHVARTVCRRAERKILALRREEEVSEILIKYVNRLSDVLYTLARYLETELKYVEFQKPSK
ncbi:cob(I)yrinic acid a,c-diamide adenosyltransferase [Thermotalea metallivorans]|uniref:Corrinoid adenosyltransferase n=1 Tax=Thermotalea metallivorans TaxID=520762 RepID=A0A140L5T3_9FIRM|nr:cob(I)yrinic acid a,c-diamide adenosyltransferase [Thermotalea metallivorans]KXG75908.1 Cob(I)yrinic acid a,c-diamide adenosyltransferase [Thermotalea metallivorans]